MLFRSSESLPVYRCLDISLGLGACLNCLSSALLLLYRDCCSGFRVGCEWDPCAPAYGFAFGGCLLAGSEFGRWSFCRFGRRSRALGGLGGGWVVVVLMGSGLLLPPGCVSSFVWVFHAFAFALCGCGQFLFRAHAIKTIEIRLR